jgi:menaquinone-dependent protoporphyrinogen oxidase
MGLSNDLGRCGWRDKLKRVIIYAGKYGCTEHCAKKLAAMLPGEVELVDLQNDPKNNGSVNLSEYDQVILGGSIYAGHASKNLRDFCGHNLPLLRSKQVALFLCCFEQGENAQAYMRRTFPRALVEQAIATGYFGWELHFAKRNRFERWMVKKIARVDQDISRIDEGAIRDLVAKCAG